MESVPTRLLSAVRFAVTNHTATTIGRPIEAAALLAECGISDVVVLQAAILHDSIGPNRATATELVEAFGEAVAELIAEVRDDLQMDGDRNPFQSRQPQLLTPAAQLIKVAISTCNMRAVTDAPPADWSLMQRLAYLERTRDATARCLGGNEELDRAFQDTLATGMEKVHPAMRRAKR